MFVNLSNYNIFPHTINKTITLLQYRNVHRDI